MNKEWFIFGNDSHVGPFAREEILQMFEEEKIYQSTLLWREGDEEWLPLEEISSFKEDVIKIIETPDVLPDIPLEVTSIEQDLPDLPDLPSIPESTEEVVDDELQTFVDVEEQTVETSLAVKEVVETNKEVEVPPVAVEETSEEIIFEKRSKESLLESFTSKLVEISKSSIVVGVCTIAVGLGLLMSFGLLSNDTKKNVKLKNVSVSQIAKLNSIISDSDQRTKAYFALTRDSQSIYMSINRLYPMIVNIEFESINNKVKSLEPIKFEVTTKVENGIGHLNLINFLRGTKIKPGHYKISLTGYRFGHDKQNDKDTKFLGKQLLYSGKVVDFEIELESFIAKEKDKKNKVYKDLIEKTNTLNSFIDMSFEEYQLVLEKAYKGKNILKFETFFIQKISPIFKEIVLQINRNILDLQQRNDPKVSYFERLHECYQIFGELVGNMVVETNKKKWIRKKDRKNLEKKFSKEIKALKSKSQDLISDLNKLLL